MINNQVKCKGTTKKGEPCNKFPLVGEEYCERHHPKKKLNRSYKKCKTLNKVVIFGWLLTIILFLASHYFSSESTKTIRQGFKKHSLAERILAGQYNPMISLENLKEVLNLMNNDPGFKKRIYIDGDNISLQTRNLIYNKDIRIDFINENAERRFEQFLTRGYKDVKISKTDYSWIYILRNEEVYDSFKNKTIEIGRDYPILPPLNISTIDPTEEYICSGLMDIQIDSIVENLIYMSNTHQTNTCKFSFQYDPISRIAGFDQLRDLYFDFNSPYYSVDQEISYNRLVLSLISNARLRIRNATTGDSILTTDPFIPVNIDAGESFKSINTHLSFLNILKIIQDYLGIVFKRSDITAEESDILKCIAYSFNNGAQIMSAPLNFTLPEIEAKKIIGNISSIEKGNYTIICNQNNINILDEYLQLGRIVIQVPPSKITYKYQEDLISFSISPFNSQDCIYYKFTDLTGLTRPKDIIYNKSVLSNKKDNAICFVKNLNILDESWKSSKVSTVPIEFWNN